MKLEKRKKNAVREMMGWLLYMAILVAAAFLLVHFVGERTVVSGDSMSPTLSDGDNLIVDKLSYRVRAPKRFELVFRSVSEGLTTSNGLSACRTNRSKDL